MSGFYNENSVTPLRTNSRTALGTKNATIKTTTKMLHDKTNKTPKVSAVKSVKNSKLGSVNPLKTVLKPNLSTLNPTATLRKSHLPNHALLDPTVNSLVREYTTQIHPNPT